RRRPPRPEGADGHAGRPPAGPDLPPQPPRQPGTGRRTVSTLDGLRRVQIEQVAAAVAPARCPPGASGIAVAYSGGPDSTVLLHALARAGYGVPIRALHVCHNLQADAAHWVTHCRATCARLGVPFECLDVHVDTGDVGMEAAAREARYAAFAQVLRPGEV